MNDALEVDVQFARAILAREAFADGKRPSLNAGAALSVTSGERALLRLNEQLVRWFGPDGVDALLMRALDRSRKQYPVLERVQRNENGELRLAAIAKQPRSGGDVVLEHPSEDDDGTAEAIAVLMATVLALIGRLVGDDMTRHLIRQIWPELDTGTVPSSNGSNKEGLDT